MNLTPNALTVLERRYLKNNESPEGMFLRVAKAVAQGDQKDEEDFFNIMTSLKFLPNSPTLMNAGLPNGQLAGCFVVPIEDNMESIFDALKAAALIHKSGGGTGFSFSNLRPKGSVVGSTNGVASGPVSFMRIFDVATEQVKQGGTRRGANMGILSCDHPDIEEFVKCKDDGSFQNFNLSVSVTDEFMARLMVSLDERTRKLWDLIVYHSWKHGDPGLLFIDTVNKNSLHPEELIEATNPCGEQPLLPWEACNLGSINLAQHITAHNSIDWSSLQLTVRTAVKFLNKVIDISQYPLPQITEMVKKYRKIGLGVMGFADVLILKGVSYNSARAFTLAEDIMSYINAVSLPPVTGLPYKNTTITTIAPTGTLSIIAGCSSGIEPIYSFNMTKNVMDDDHLSENYAGYAENKDLLDAEGNKVYITAHEVKTEQHVKIQAAFQKHTDNAVSKTVNLPHSATVKDVEKVFFLAYQLGCKGVTVYRDGSYANQVLTDNSKAPTHEEMINVTRKYFFEDAAIDTPGPDSDLYNVIKEPSHLMEDFLVGPDLKPKKKHAVTERTLPIAPDRPEVLPGWTFKIQTGLGNLYVTINENEGVPVEVFCTIGKSGKSTMAKTEAIGRLVSLALRNQIPVKNIVKQLKGISGEKPIMTKNGMVWSIPDALGSLLEKLYITKDPVTASYQDDKGEFVPVSLLKEECPDCGASLVFEEGCSKCTWCGYSKC